MSESYEAWIPWQWVIIPSDRSVSCSSPAAVLGTFAAVNGAVSILGVFCGHKSIVNAITFGLLGGEHSKSWRYMWVFSVGLQLAANAAIAGLIYNSPEVIPLFKISDLMLFYIARPRLSWIVVSLLSTLNVRSGWPWRPSDGLWENPLEGAALAQMIAEFVLQLMACYPMGYVVWQGSDTRVYDLITLNYDIPPLVRLMYAGALYYLVMGGISLVVLTVLAVSFCRHHQSPNRTYYIRIVMCLVLISTWLGSWLFWVGFVNFMAGIEL
jgi:hypothetical protein